MVLRPEPAPVEHRIVQLESDMARMRTDMSEIKSEIRRLDSKLNALRRADDWSERAWNLFCAGFSLFFLMLTFKLVASK